MSTDDGSLVTSTKSAGVSVMPMESMRAARAPVKYSVVKKSNDEGRLRARAVKRMVQRGKRVVAALATLVYVSKILEPVDFSESAASELIWIADDFAMSIETLDLRFAETENAAG
mmetsp:Transcript_18748/g.40617  ORF Transcript_18748/g.40617 Transcript_18748/m.40617 type:complete len:115 (-) Transcript_18748:187-531(-)